MYSILSERHLSPSLSHLQTCSVGKPEQLQQSFVQETHDFQHQTCPITPTHSTSPPDPPPRGPGLSRGLVLSSLVRLALPFLPFGSEASGPRAFAGSVGRSVGLEGKEGPSRKRGRPSPFGPALGGAGSDIVCCLFFFWGGYGAVGEDIPRKSSRAYIHELASSSGIRRKVPFRSFQQLLQSES